MIKIWGHGCQRFSPLMNDINPGKEKDKKCWVPCPHIYITFYFGFSWCGALFFFSEEVGTFIFIKNCCMKLNNNLSISKKSNGQNNGLLPFAPFFLSLFLFAFWIPNSEVVFNSEPQSSQSFLEPWEHGKKYFEF